jgi:hypothetical protein
LFCTNNFNHKSEAVAFGIVQVIFRKIIFLPIFGLKDESSNDNSKYKVYEPNLNLKLMIQEFGFKTHVSFFSIWSKSATPIPAVGLLGMSWTMSQVLFEEADDRGWICELLC